MIAVKVQLTETSQPIEHTAVNTYTKSLLYCVYLENGTVVKYPLCQHLAGH